MRIRIIEQMASAWFVGVSMTAALGFLAGAAKGDDSIKPGAVWRRIPGDPQPDIHMEPYVKNGQVTPGNGTLTLKYFNNITQREAYASWAYTVPPETLVVGSAYSWDLTPISDDAVTTPGAPNVPKGAAKLSVDGNLQGPGNKLETSYVTIMLSDHDRQMGNSRTADGVNFTFEPGKAAVTVGVGLSGFGALVFRYQYDPNGAPSGGGGHQPGGVGGKVPAIVGDGPADQPTTMTLYEWQAQRVVQAGGWLSGVSLDGQGNIVGIYFRPYNRVLSSHTDSSQPILAFQQTRHFQVGPESYIPLSGPLIAPTDPAAIEAEINALLVQIDTWQRHRNAAETSGNAAEMARADAALPGLQLRLRILNFVQMNRK